MMGRIEGCVELGGVRVHLRVEGRLVRVVVDGGERSELTRDVLVAVDRGARATVLEDASSEVARVRLLERWGPAVVAAVADATVEAPSQVGEDVLDAVGERRGVVLAFPAVVDGELAA
ncbi:MAG: hypothetical protein RLO52_34550 [Sandaracinaceae bacterium]